MIMGINKRSCGIITTLRKTRIKFQKCTCVFLFLLSQKISKPSLQKTHAYFLQKRKKKSLQKNDNQKKTAKYLCQEFEKQYKNTFDACFHSHFEWKEKTIPKQGYEWKPKHIIGLFKNIFSIKTWCQNKARNEHKEEQMKSICKPFRL